MGFDQERFLRAIERDLICPICDDVMEDAVQRGECEHVFCRHCITNWLQDNSNCPSCRSALTAEELKEPRVVRNLLGQLQIKCDFQPRGCRVTVCLESLVEHRGNCRYNPDNIKHCDTCNTEYCILDAPPHDCIREIREMFEVSIHGIGDMAQESKAIASSVGDSVVLLQCEMEQQFEAMRKEINVLRNMVRTLREERDTGVRPKIPERQQTRGKKIEPIPQNLNVSSVIVSTLYSYRAKNEDELSFEKDELIEYGADTEDNGWGIGWKNGRFGYYPMSLTEIIQK